MLLEISSMDIFLWGHLKEQVYAVPVVNVEGLVT
jgi:hypothetical protein